MALVLPILRRANTTLLCLSSSSQTNWKVRLRSSSIFHHRMRHTQDSHVLVADFVSSKHLSCPPDAGIVRIELSHGAGLPSYSSLYRAIASGVPTVVSGIDPGDDNLTPEYFIQRHGEELVTVINTVTGEDRTLPLATFMQPFNVSDSDSAANPEKLKVPLSCYARRLRIAAKLVARIGRPRRTLTPLSRTCSRYSSRF